MANRREFNDVMRLFFSGGSRAILDEVVLLKDGDQIAARVRQIHEVLGTTPAGGNVVLVTHYVTVHDATGEGPQEGELVVFTPRGDGQFTSVGRLAPGGLLCDPRLRSC